jgi:hypothetical protein
MSRAKAEKLVELMLRHGRELDKSVRCVQSAASQAEFDRFRKPVGRIMGHMLLEVMNPIFDEHPDLKSPQLR